jgi:hypothetical protein
METARQLNNLHLMVNRMINLVKESDRQLREEV